MAYDLHIVRTASWLDAAEDPITKEQVDALVAADPELEWSTTDWIDLSGPRSRKLTRFFAILWQGEPCFWWIRHEIQCPGPSEAALGKMVDMASKLHARVFGDDGEEYRPSTWRAVFRGELRG